MGQAHFSVWRTQAWTHRPCPWSPETAAPPTTLLSWTHPSRSCPGLLPLFAQPVHCPVYHDPILPICWWLPEVKLYAHDFSPVCTLPVMPLLGTPAHSSLGRSTLNGALSQQSLLLSSQIFTCGRTLSHLPWPDLEHGFGSTWVTALNFILTPYSSFIIINADIPRVAFLSKKCSFPPSSPFLSTLHGNCCPPGRLPQCSVASCHLESMPGLPVRTFWDGLLSSFSHNFLSRSLGTWDYLPAIPTGATCSHFPRDQCLGCHCSYLLHGNQPFAL